MTIKHVLRSGALAAALGSLALPALAIQGGTPTTAFPEVGRGVQVTEDWVLTVVHYSLNPGDIYSNGFGSRVVAARYDVPGSYTVADVPVNDISLLRLVPLATAATFVSVLGETVPYGSFPGFAATITSADNSSGPRARGFTTITESVATYDPDDVGPLGPVPVNWLVSEDASVYVQSGDSGGGLFLGHVTNTSVLLGLSTVQFGDANGTPNGSGFVQPAAYRSWIDQKMLDDTADAQFIHWTTAAVPEPATWALWGLGLAGIATLARRRHRPA